jgi:single-strand DNA-binding protein
MAGLCKVCLIGHLGKDPEVKYTPEGLAIANFSLAATEKVKIKGQNQDKTEWFKVVAFGKLGEICGQYLKKGKQVYIEGRLQSSEWTDQQGEKRFSLEVIAAQMVMLGSSGGNNDSGDGA